MTSNQTSADSADIIFSEAVQRAAGQDRSRFLDAACASDPEKRRHVERLLRAYAEADSFLESPASDPLSTPIDGQIERPGDVIGSYTLIEQIGEGGFGVVFLAEQQQPVRRKVALKVIKPGMDTRAVIGRFEAERQALALMDHPHIAKVFDAGSTESGRPYFVMELVQGVPITDYCDQCGLTTRERLELFVLVCQAVQHAHQKGVIHRDLKPTNILVALQDGRPVPKIIDFGVAKAVNQRLTEHTLASGFFQMIGTPMYMSPEQAELSPLGVDTRSDIYSLGVLLYELLTGMTPFDKTRLQSAGYDELRRIIREEEPPRPSVRISTLSADLATTVAEHRRTDPSRLRQQLRSDLDWIVMKCLEKDRNRRYETASSLAQDIERHVADEPVAACPPSAAYRLQKFVRRNKVPVLAASVVLLALIGGVIGTTWGLLRAVDARLIARQSEAAAVQARDDAHQAINDYFITVSEEDALRHDPRLKPLRRKLLERPLVYYEKFVRQNAPSPELRAEMAAVCSRIAISTYELGTGADHLEWIEKSTSILEGLLAEGHDLVKFESLTVGQRWLSETVEVWFSDPDRTREVLERACRVGEELVGRYSNVDGFKNDLAAYYMALASLHMRVDDNRKLELNEKALRLWEDLKERHPDVPDYRLSYADCVSCIGSTRVQLRQSPPIAEEELRLGVAMAEELVKDLPDNPGCREFLATMHEELGFFLEHAGRLDEAEEAYQWMLSGYEGLRQLYPGVSGYENGVFRAQIFLGEVVWHTKGAAEARPHFEAVCEIGDRLAASDPFAAHAYGWFLATCADRAFRDAEKAAHHAQAVIEAWPHVADGRTILGMAHFEKGDYEAAIDELQRGTELRLFWEGCPARFFLAMAYAAAGQKEDAREWYDAGVRQMKTEHEMLEFHRFRREAAKRLGIPLPETAVPIGKDQAEVTIVKEIIVFGASMCDNGNAFILSKGQVAAGPYFGGRLTNGPVWVERLAERLELGEPGETAPVPVPSEVGGTNYAVGGAKAGSGFSDACILVDGAEVCAPNIGLQIEYFFKRDSRTLDGDELIVVQGGNNNAFEVDAATAMADHVATLAAAGGRFFLVPQLFRASQSPGNAPKDAWDEFVASFNAQLEDQLAALEAKLDVVIVRPDLLALTDEIIGNPGKFGFANVTEPACPGCGFGIPGPDAEQTIVPNAKEYLYWDDFHFTAEANRIIGDVAFERLRRAMKRSETGDRRSE